MALSQSAPATRPRRDCPDDQMARLPNVVRLVPVSAQSVSCVTHSAGTSPNAPPSGVVVETSTSLSTKEAGVDHPGEQRRSGIQRFLELFVQRLGDRLGRVQPDQVR
jgi:hypothetical protein